MKKPQKLIGILHIPYPGIPSSVFKTIAESRKYEDDGEDGEGRVYACDYVCNDLARWRYDGDSELPEAHVDFVVEEGSARLL